jgi:hypothetical protein
MRFDLNERISIPRSSAGWSAAGSTKSRFFRSPPSDFIPAAVSHQLKRHLRNVLGNTGYEFQRIKYLKIPLVPVMAHLGVCAYLERYNTVPVSSVYWTLAKPKGVANNVLRQVLYPPARPCRHQ